MHAHICTHTHTHICTHTPARGAREHAPGVCVEYGAAAQPLVEGGADGGGCYLEDGVGLPEPCLAHALHAWCGGKHGPGKVQVGQQLLKCQRVHTAVHRPLEVCTKEGTGEGMLHT